MTKQKLVKITDINGQAFEYEDCELLEGLGKLTVFVNVGGDGLLKKTFFTRNLISVETILIKE